MELTASNHYDRLIFGETEKLQDNRSVFEGYLNIAKRTYAHKMIYAKTKHTNDRFHTQF